MIRGLVSSSRNIRSSKVVGGGCWGGNMVTVTFVISLLLSFVFVTHISSEAFVVVSLTTTARTNGSWRRRTRVGIAGRNDATKASFSSSSISSTMPTIPFLRVTCPISNIQFYPRPGFVITTSVSSQCTLRSDMTTILSTEADQKMSSKETKTEEEEEEDGYDDEIETMRSSPLSVPYAGPSSANAYRHRSSLIDAASTVTQQSCQLLGVKSIGVDYGLVRTGVAVTVGYDPKPLAILVSSPVVAASATAENETETGTETESSCSETDEDDDGYDNYEFDFSILEEAENGNDNDNEVETDEEDDQEEEKDTSLSTNTTDLCLQIIQYAVTEQASRIVVGLPLHKNGTVAEQTNITLSFAKELTEMSLRRLGPGVPVLLWDERYTSKEAAARAHSRNPNRFLYGTLDADAACIILENYYNDNGVGAQMVQLDPETRERCSTEFEQKRQEELTRLRVARDERENKLRMRREAIARDRQLEAEEQAARNAINNSGSSSLSAASTKKKKKNKKKRRRRK